MPSSPFTPTHLCLQGSCFGTDQYDRQREGEGEGAPPPLWCACQGRLGVGGMFN